MKDWRWNWWQEGLKNPLVIIVLVLFGFCVALPPFARELAATRAANSQRFFGFKVSAPHTCDPGQREQIERVMNDLKAASLKGGVGERKNWLDARDAAYYDCGVKFELE